MQYNGLILTQIFFILFKAFESNNQRHSKILNMPTFAAAPLCVADVDRLEDGMHRILAARMHGPTLRILDCCAGIDAKWYPGSYRLLLVPITSLTFWFMHVYGRYIYCIHWFIIKPLITGGTTTLGSQDGIILICIEVATPLSLAFESWHRHHWPLGFIVGIWHIALT